MILSYFIPEYIGSYFLLSRRTASIVITQRFVRIAVVRAARTQRFIEKLIEEPIDQNPDIPREELVSHALLKALASVPPQATIISVFPSTQTICKVITVPLMSLEKIKMIVPFEVEASLPFSLAEALIDCVVTHTNKEEKTAQVIVVATRRNLLQDHTAIYSHTTVKPNIITTEVIALFGLMSDGVRLTADHTPALVICVEETMTIMILAEQQRIISQRIIPHNSPLLVVPDMTNFTTSPLLEQEIALTAQNFIHLINEQRRESVRILICGSGVENKRLHATLNEALNKECELLTINKILHSGVIHSPQGLTNNFLIPVAAALPCSATDSFNLDTEIAEAAQQRSLITQIILAAGIVFLLISVLLVTRIIVIRNLKSEIVAAEKETIDLILARIPSLEVKKGASLDTVNKLANASVLNEEAIWFSLSSKNRSTVLLALSELSKHINREQLGLKLQEVSISESTNSMVLTGEVKDFPELYILQESLRKSPFFKNIPNLQEKKFTAKITLDTDAGEQ